MPAKGDDQVPVAGFTEVAAQLRAFNEQLLLTTLREQEVAATAERGRAILEALLATLHEGVVIIEASGRVQMLNAAARLVLGLGAGDEASIDRLSQLDLRRLDMTYLPLAERPFTRAMQGEFFADLESLLVLADGVVRRVAASCTSTRDGLDGPVSIVVLRDLTERQRMEARLAQTVRLASIGALAAGVAHEINNPLTYVMANVELVTDELRAIGARSPGVEVTPLEQLLADARIGAAKIAKVVSSLQTFAATRAERRAVVDVRTVLGRACDLSMNELVHRARVVTDYAPVPFVEVDEARLCQVFVNLLIHAAHAMPEADAARNAIHVSTSTGADGMAIITIRDTGPGLADEVLAHVFEPFFMTSEPGLGLGLSVCRNIVLAMGGAVDVESRPGRGTTFRIALPVATSESSAPPPSASVPPASLRRATVLVVDDEPRIGAVLRRILVEHEITVATSVPEALALLDAGRTFDVVFSDLMMPVQSGIDFYEALAHGSPELLERLVFISGGAFTAAGHAFLERVPNARIQKPFDAQTIRAAVSKLLEDKS